MDIDNLNTFLTVIKSGSFSKAAKELYISQPAISTQIRKLEQELGISLMKRSKSGISMTFAGRTLYHFSEQVLHEYANMMQHIYQLRSEQVHELNVISSPIPAEFIIPNILIDFKEKYSPIGMNVTVTASTKVIEGVLAGNYEVGFCSIKIESDELEFIKIEQDEIVLVVSLHHPLSSREEISMYELSGETIITRESVKNKTGEVNLLMEAGLDFSLFKFNLIIGTFSGVISTVERGVGIAFLPYLSVKRAEALGQVKILKIKDIVVTREYYFLYRKNADKSRPLEEFRHFLVNDFRAQNCVDENDS